MVLKTDAGGLSRTTMHLESKNCSKTNEDPQLQLSTSISVEESVQMIKSEVIPCLQNAMQTLQDIWTEIGLPEDQKEERTRTVLLHLRNLLQDMVNEEEDLKSTLQANVETCSKELEKLCKELSLPGYKVEGKMSILMLENELRTRVDNLKLEKHDRLRNLKALKEKESKLCDRLCLPPHNLGEVDVPTKDQLKELEANVEYLKNEMIKRLDVFKELKHLIQSLWVELESAPSTTLGLEIAQENAENTFKLTSKNMEGLKALLHELDQQQQKNSTEAEQLRGTINSLWAKLELDESEKECFLRNHTGYKPSVISGLKNEVERLQALKLTYMKKFIDGLRKELADLWEKCYFGPAQREEFAPAFDENYTEDLLHLHECQVDFMKNYYEENKAIFKCVEKREALFKTMEEFENRKNDTNRLANRGGALLKEEKLRKGIKRELPKIEQKLKVEIEQWEAEHEGHFLINGCHYLDIINHQWAAFSAQKEHEKMERHKQKQEIMEKEMVFGSKPATTPKKRPLGGTPLKTPKRIRMQEGTTISTPSKFSVHSSVCPSPRPIANPAGRPPVAAKSTGKSKKVAKLAAKPTKKTAPRRLSARLAVKRQVLGEKNVNSSASKVNMSPNTSIHVVKGSSSVSNKDTSLIACNSYNDFANGLDQVENNNCRSSLAGSRSHSIITFL